MLRTRNTQASALLRRSRLGFIATFPGLNALFIHTKRGESGIPRRMTTQRRTMPIVTFLSLAGISPHRKEYLFAKVKASKGE
jgi:hypothetical protein